MPLDNYRGYGDFDLCDPRAVTSSKWTADRLSIRSLVRPVRP